MNALITVACLMLLLVGWVAIQSAARRTAERHPECGPFREAGGGCAGGKGCCSSTRSERPHGDRRVIEITPEGRP